MLAAATPNNAMADFSLPSSAACARPNSHAIIVQESPLVGRAHQPRGAGQSGAGMYTQARGLLGAAASSPPMLIGYRRPGADGR